MALIPDVHLSGSFVNLNTETGFAVNQNFFIEYALVPVTIVAP